MAVEAQVCPQCGATIQFGPGQTQVVCGHCGTTVVSSTAAGVGGDTVAKEIEAEKLVQETAAREKKLRSRGRPATGQIVSAQATDIFRQTPEGRAVLMALSVDVQPEGEAAFTAAATLLVGLAAVAKYQAGMLLDVRYDPQDHAHVSVEGQPRHAKEQAQHQAQRAQPGEMHTAKPAWGGEQPQPHGHQVPAGFEHVDNLGHVSAVHEPQGLPLRLSFGPPRANVVVRYHKGLAYRTNGPEVNVWRWDEVASIQSNLIDRYARHSLLPQAPQEYTLTKNGGEKLILDNGIKDVEDLMSVVKDAVYRLIGPALEQRYESGEALTFGPATVQRQNGLTLEGKLYAWKDIQNVEVNEGEFRVMLRTGQKHKTYAAEIPNVELLCQLIGVKLGWRALERQA